MPQKLFYALLIASGKLRHFFQGHQIKVLTKFPLERVLHNPTRLDVWQSGESSFKLLPWSSSDQDHQKLSTGRVRGRMDAFHSGKCMGTIHPPWAGSPRVLGDELRWRLLLQGVGAGVIFTSLIACICVGISPKRRG